MFPKQKKPYTKFAVTNRERRNSKASLARTDSNKSSFRGTNNSDVSISNWNTKKEIINVKEMTEELKTANLNAYQIDKVALYISKL